MKTYVAIAVIQHKKETDVINVIPICSSLVENLVKKVTLEVEERLIKLYGSDYHISVNMHPVEMDVKDVDYAFMKAETRLLMTDPYRDKYVDPVKFGFIDIDDVKSNEQDVDKKY